MQELPRGNDPGAPVEKRTVPVGVVGPAAEVSETVAVHAVAFGAITDGGVHDTLVVVG